MGRESLFAIGFGAAAIVLTTLTTPYLAGVVGGFVAGASQREGVVQALISTSGALLISSIPTAYILFLQSVDIATGGIVAPETAMILLLFGVIPSTALLFAPVGAHVRGKLE